MSIADSMAGLAMGKKSGGIADRMKAPAPAAPEEEAGGSEIHANGDGSYRVKTGGAETDHPSFGHAMGKLAQAHGEVEGGHDQENLEALKTALEQFFTEEENEGSTGDEGDGAGESLLD